MANAYADQASTVTQSVRARAVPARWAPRLHALLRIGVGRDIDLENAKRALGLQLGLVLRSISYHLQQTDHVELTQRALHTGWLEWTPTWGLSLRFPDLELRYRGRVTHGTDRLVATPDQIIAFADQRPLGFFPPPGASPTLDGVHVVTHQFSVSLPLR